MKYLRSHLIHCLGFVLSASLFHQHASAQACRDVTPAEQQLYQKMVTAWDQAVLPATRRDGLDGHLRNEQVTPTVSRGKPGPERPMMFCSEQRFVIDCQSNGESAMEVRAGINTPLLILSSPHSGPIPATCHKISIPGVAIAYELTWHKAGETDHYKIILGLGRWKEDVKNYDLSSELYVHYHFNHPFPAPVIENVIVTITAGNLEAARRLAANIDWKTLDALLE